MAKLRQNLRHIEMMGKKDEGDIVTERTGIATVGEIDAGTATVGDQPRRVGDQTREAADAQRHQDSPGNESCPNPPHQSCGLLTPASGGLGSATAVPARCGR